MIDGEFDCFPSICPNDLINSLIQVNNNNNNNNTNSNHININNNHSHINNNNNNNNHHHHHHSNCNNVNEIGINDTIIKIKDEIIMQTDDGYLDDDGLLSQNSNELDSFNSSCTTTTTNTNTTSNTTCSRSNSVRSNSSDNNSLDVQEYIDVIELAHKTANNHNNNILINNIQTIHNYPQKCGGNQTASNNNNSHNNVVLSQEQQTKYSNQKIADIADKLQSNYFNFIFIFNSKLNSLIN